MMKKICFSPARWLPLAAVYGLFLFINLGVGAKFDDAAFMESFAAFDHDLIDWSVYFWNNWSSRVLPSALTALLMTRAPFVFGLLNALMQTAAVWLIADLALACRSGEGAATRPGLRGLVLAAVCVVYLFHIPYEIRQESDLWRMSSSTYLWGGVCALYCIRPFEALLRGRPARLPLPGCCLAVAAAVYAAGCEQAAPIIVAFGLACQGYALLCRQKPWAFGWAVIGITLAGFLLSLTAPGNALRTDTEILMNAGWYPATGMAAGLFFGVVTALRLLTGQLAGLLLAVSVLLAVQLFRTGGLWQRLCALLPCGYFGMLVLIQWYRANLPGVPLPGNIDYLLFDIIPSAPPAVSYAPTQWLATALAIFVCALLGGMLFCWQTPQQGLYTGLLYAAAFADIIVVGFTVSGRFGSLRTAFIAALLLIAVVARQALAAVPQQAAAPHREELLHV